MDAKYIFARKKSKKKIIVAQKNKKNDFNFKQRGNKIRFHKKT